MAKTAALILAAGNSSRLGRSKQLLTSKSGLNLLELTINEIRKSKVDSIYLVLGARFKEHVDALQDLKGIEVIENTNWTQGMGSSLKVGLKRILELEPTIEACLVTVCDQPALHTEVLNELIHSHETGSASIVAARYNSNVFGVPVLFDKSCFLELFQIPDKAGALGFVKQNLDRTTFVDFPEGIDDVDTEADVRRLGLS